MPREVSPTAHAGGESAEACGSTSSGASDGLRVGWWSVAADVDDADRVRHGIRNPPAEHREVIGDAHLPLVLGLFFTGYLPHLAWCWWCDRRDRQHRIVIEQFITVLNGLDAEWSKQ